MEDEMPPEIIKLKDPPLTAPPVVEFIEWEGGIELAPIVPDFDDEAEDLDDDVDDDIEVVVYLSPPFRMSLSDLKVLVTGASSGIGRETCKILSQNYNAMVIGSARNRNALDAMLKEGSIQNFIVADVTQPGECERIVEEAVVLMGGSITTVVNAAGGLEGGAVGDAGCNLKNYEYNMNVNCKAPFAIMMAAIPFLKQNSKKNASIVTVSSVNGKQSFAGCATYCMAKAAVDQMTRSMCLGRLGEVWNSSEQRQSRSYHDKSSSHSWHGRRIIYCIFRTKYSNDTPAI
ncbi:estradiol 17-beta-dehydrogenase [Nitzschia inconspicua]|uniref:Estradiol 17-beta-dehydrogenase n=1 Tax=Nitzschia inconspicua TaxID=303405 RepID=A0A9K3Q3V2_9STRA|nr:estradiol 17-beta-dehydrogenase [Nitzschia inconspicua]